MTKYYVSGSYLFHGRENPFAGEIEIYENGRITGEIIDTTPPYPMREAKEHKVGGRTSIEDGKRILNFERKIPGLVESTFYFLEKSYGKGIVGEYEGYRLLRKKRKGKGGNKVFLKLSEIATSSESPESLQSHL